MDASFLSGLERLPDPSEVTPRKDLVISTRAQCHGCGQDFEKPSLKRCTACKRVYYCSKSCQAKDYRKPMRHKQCCHPNLLSLAMDNIRRLPVDQKLQHMAAGNAHLVPNSHFCQTVAKVSCPSVSEFLQCARREYILVRDKLCFNKTASEAAMCEGNCQYDLVDQNRYGLDVGVEALCAAINMWPGVYTINSCSGLHAGAWMPSTAGPDPHFCSDLVQFVSDDADALNRIQAIFERGGFGIRYQVTKMDGQSDPIGRQDGFVVIDCDLGDGLPRKCRTYGRAVTWTPEPFDKLDSILWMMTYEKPPLQRMQNNLIGFLGVAVELVRANPSLDLSEEQVQELKETEKPMMMLRKWLIEFKCERLELTMQQQQDEGPLASSMAKITAEMHQRVTASSVFEMKESQKQKQQPPPPP